MLESIKSTFDLSAKVVGIKNKVNTFIVLFLIFFGCGVLGVISVKLLNPFIYEFMISKGWLFYSPKSPVNTEFDFSIIDILFGIGLILFVSLKEELMFRLWLSVDRLKLILGLIIFGLGIILQFGIYGICIIPLLLLILILHYHKVSLYFLILISSLIFGAYHISNFGYFEFRNPIAFIFLPIICIGQTLGGVIIAVARIRLSFCWGVLLHILGNILFITLTLNLLR